MRNTVVIAVLVLSSQAHAQEDAKALFQQAEAHYAANEFQQALDKYTAAYRLKPLTGFLFNMGQCERRLGRCKDALVHFRNFVRLLPNAPNRGMADDLIRECEENIKRSPPAESPQPSAPDPKPQPQVTKRPGGGLHPAWFWTSAGLSVALLATGTVTGIVTLQKNDEFKDEATSRESQLDLQKSGRMTGNISTATLVAGGVFAAATGVLYFFTRWGSEKNIDVAAAVLPGGGGVSIHASF